MTYPRDVWWPVFNSPALNYGHLVIVISWKERISLNNERSLILPRLKLTPLPE